MRNVQWSMSILMPAESTEALGDVHSLTPSYSEPFPYLVPAGYWLAITDVTIQSKLVSAVASYFVINGLFSLPSNIGVWSFRTPRVVPPGIELTAAVINNAPQTQWINISMQGWLIPKTSDDYRDALAAYFFPVV